MECSDVSQCKCFFTLLVSGVGYCSGDEMVNGMVLSELGSMGFEKSRDSGQRHR